METLPSEQVSTLNGPSPPPIAAEPNAADQLRTRGSVSSSSVTINAKPREFSSSGRSSSSSTAEAGATTQMSRSIFRRSSLVGVLASLFLLAAMTNFFWAELGQSKNDGNIIGNVDGNESGSGSGSSGGPWGEGSDGGDERAGAAAAAAAAAAAPGILLEPPEEARPAAITAALASAKSTALLVAVDNSPAGRMALQLWSDFARFAQEQRRETLAATTAAAAALARGGRQLGGGGGGADGGTDGRGSDSREDLRGSGLGLRHRRGTRSRGDGLGRAAGKSTPVASAAAARELEQDAASSVPLFPPVWILTSDAAMDKAIRQDMPHLSSFFVRGLFGSEAGEEEMASTAPAAVVAPPNRRRIAAVDAAAAGLPASTAAAAPAAGSRAAEEALGATATAAATKTKSRRVDAAASPPPPPALLSSWSDVLELFISRNPDVSVFGLFGEGALPTTALLPPPSSFYTPATGLGGADADAPPGDVGRQRLRDVGGDVSGGRDGHAIESILWPVLSQAVPPTVVFGRARGWWVEEEEGGGRTAGGRWSDSENGGVAVGAGRVGEWMSDRFVSQVWCNRAILAAARRPATGLGKLELIGGGRGGGEEQEGEDGEGGLASFLHVIERLVRDPGAVGAVLVDGTAAVPARYLCSPTAADEDADGAGGVGGGGGGGGEGGRGLANRSWGAEDPVATDGASSSGGGGGLDRQSSGGVPDISVVVGGDPARENNSQGTWQHRSPLPGWKSSRKSGERQKNSRGRGWGEKAEVTAKGDGVGHARRADEVEPDAPKGDQVGEGTIDVEPDAPKEDQVGAGTNDVEPDTPSKEDQVGEEAIEKKEGSQHYVYLHLLAQNAFEISAQENRDRQGHEQAPGDPAAVRGTTGGSSIGDEDTLAAIPLERQQQRHRLPLPEADLYIGTLELALGAGIEAKPSSPAARVADNAAAAGVGDGRSLDSEVPAAEAGAAAGFAGSGDDPPHRVAGAAAAAAGTASTGAKIRRNQGAGGIGGRREQEEQGIAPDGGDDGGRAVGGEGGSAGGGDGGGDSSAAGSSVGVAAAAAAAVATPKIVRAKWPPPYILENVVQERKQSDGVGQRGGGGGSNNRKDEGYVIVTNVNCGYVDMAVNFLLWARWAARDVKVLVVAMDEASFDFLDALAPGSIAMYPQKSSERQHAVKAGQWGDDIFKHEAVVRPDILLSILRQGYKLLWTDVDMVWLRNPLPLLPDTRANATAAEVMVQLDGQTNNKCTCFMFLDCTPLAINLIDLWKREIVETKVAQNQIAFGKPLVQMVDAGLRLEILPDEVMPPGLNIFDDGFMKANYDRYHDKLRVVHNNWIIGHDAKRDRFRQADLWKVDDWDLPNCERRTS